MSEKARVPPSVEGIFWILAQIPKERLDQYKHQLSHARRDWRICQLLRGMVLLTLKQEAEARASLDALGYDIVVACIYRSHWGPAKVGQVDRASYKPDAEVAWAVARIYALLAEEKLCRPQERDEAYRVALQTFQESRAEAAKLKSVLEEAQEKCGMGLLSATPGNCLGMLAADLGGSLSQPAGSPPTPTQSSPEPHSLRSTGTPLSSVSHFEISPATTMAWISGSDREQDAVDGEVGGSTSDPPGLNGREEAGHQPPVNSPLQCAGASETRLPRLTGGLVDRPPASRLVEGEGRPPLNSTQPPDGAEKEPWAPERGLLQNPGTLPVPQPVSTTPARCSPKATESPPLPTSEEKAEPRGSPSSASPPQPTGSSTGGEDQFFSFVVLHAVEDEEVAFRVKSELEHLGVPDGATYSDDFLVPGRCHLDCFQEALDNSAFTLLLLTKNFRNRFCAYQTNVALMESFRRFRYRNAVIPFIPKENPIPKREMPSTLAGLVPLEEASPVFHRRVEKTFTPAAIQEKKAAWSHRRQIQRYHRQREMEQEQQELQRRLSELSTDARLPVPPTVFPGFQAPPGPFPSPQFSGPFLASAMGQGPTGPDHPSVSQPFLVSLGSGGPPPQLIIQNAQMIQIGDYNCMQAEQANPALGPPGPRPPSGPACANGGGSNPAPDTLDVNTVGDAGHFG